MFTLNKKRIVTLMVTIFLSAVVLFSCKTNTVMSTTASAAASLRAEPMKVWTRPIETGYSVMGMAEGTYSEDGSEKAVGSTPSFFIGTADPSISMSPGVKMAAFNAIQKGGADGMYITMAKEEENFNESGGSVKKYWVKGVLLKLVFYDPVSPERSDRDRSCEKDCLPLNCCHIGRDANKTQY